MSDTRAAPSREGGGGAGGGQSAQSALQFGVNNGFRTLRGALAGFNLLARNLGGLAVGLDLLQAGGDYLGQMALLVALGYADGFIQLAFAQRAGDHRSELP